MSDRDRQKIIGTILIPEARQAQAVVMTQEESVPIALELFYTALAMKASEQRAALFIARRFADRMRLDPYQIQSFASFRLTEELNGITGNDGEDS